MDEWCLETTETTNINQPMRWIGNLSKVQNCTHGPSKLTHQPTWKFFDSTFGLPAGPLETDIKENGGINPSLTVSMFVLQQVILWLVHHQWS
jgi:hypothetical protein